MNSSHDLIQLVKKFLAEFGDSDRKEYRREFVVYKPEMEKPKIILSLIGESFYRDGKIAFYKTLGYSIFEMDGSLIYHHI